MTVTLSVSTPTNDSQQNLEAQKSAETNWMGRSIRKLIPASEESSFRKIFAIVVCFTITTGFILGGGIAYGVMTYECNARPDQCDNTGRYASYLILCIGEGICAVQCCGLLIGCGAAASGKE